MARRANRQIWGVVGILALMLLGPEIQAGPIFVPGRMVDGEFVPPKPPADDPEAKPAAAVGYSIRFGTISAKVSQDGVATELRETIQAPDTAVHTVALIPLPKGTDADSLKVKAGEVRSKLNAVKHVKFLDEQAAEKLFQRLTTQTDNVAFAALAGRPVAIVPEFQLRGRFEFVVEYRQRVQTHEGVNYVQLPTPAASWASGPVERLTITAELNSNLPLRALFSPTHETEFERSSLTEAVARVRYDQFASGNDYRLCWVSDADDLGLRVLTHRVEGEDEGFFMLVGNPTGRADGSDAVDKDVTFVLDTSGSMRGEKIEQCRAAIEYCLEHLNRGDRFNIVTFGTEVESFRKGLVSGSEANVEAARDFVEQIVAHGRTNIDDALKTALAGDAQEGRPRITIFLTDGTPTAGELVPETILKNAEAANTSDARVFVLGVGHDVNVHLLEKLAEASEGSSEFVEPDEEIDAKVAALYDRLAYPVLADAKIDFGELQTHDVFPQKIPALFRNSPVVLFGRYREGGKHTAKILGTLAGKPREFTVAFHAPEKPSGSTHDFVAPLWASRTIGYLLQEIRLHGENPELLQEIVRLSKKYGIVTEYTNFVAAASPAMPGLSASRGFGGGAFLEEARQQLNQFSPAPLALNGAAGEFDYELAVREATKRLNQARDFRTGRYAVVQAKNDKLLQSKIVAADAANAYFDRQGRKVALDTVRQVGGRTYYLVAGQWNEAAEAGERKERVVQLYSDEYFKLLKSNDDFRRAQTLGWALSINVGDERIVVEKEGKQVDVELLQKLNPDVAPEQLQQLIDQQQQLQQQLREQDDQERLQQQKVDK